jgi:hypothetical protein
MGSRTPKGTEALTGGGEAERLFQSGHGIPPMSAAQASSATAQPSTSGHTGMLRYSSMISRVLYLRANQRSIITNSSPSG